MDVLAEGGKLEVGVDDEHPEDQQRDRTDLHIRGEVVAWSEEQPHRKHGGRKPVGAQQDRQLVVVEQEQLTGPGSGDPASSDHRRDQHDHAHGARTPDRARPDLEHVEAHSDRDRDRQSDCS